MKDHWSKVETENLKVYKGNILSYLPNNRSGFIACDSPDTENIYFTLRSLIGNAQEYPVNTEVIFNIEDTWNRTRNQASKIAVNVKVSNPETATLVA